MNPEIKAEWVKRLRSGDYAQGSGSLCRLYEGVAHYCCLGVLSEIACEEGIVEARAIGSTGSAYSQYYAWLQAENSGLLLKVQKWAGISSRLGNYTPKNPTLPIERGPFVSLATLNDHGVPFAKIADIIEENF